mmetsp:Transcript_47348/g.110357  ORF Transcript_47348/g.110357 Transcript_47348/m.110357 type:complete len:224 (-) Transcript_47348:596-1267(-)
MLSEVDLAMNLRLLVLSPLLNDCLRITYMFTPSCGDSDRFCQLLVTVLVQDVPIIIWHRQPPCRQIRRVLWRKSAAQSAVVEYYIRIAILLCAQYSTIIIPYILNAILRSGERLSSIISWPKQTLLPLLSSRCLEQPATGTRLELIAVVCVVQEELSDLVKVDVYNDGRELTDPCQCHPEVIVTKAKFGHALLQTGQCSLVVFLRQGSNVPHSLLLAWLHSCH